LSLFLAHLTSHPEQDTSTVSHSSDMTVSIV